MLGLFVASKASSAGVGVGRGPPEALQVVAEGNRLRVSDNFALESAELRRAEKLIFA